MVPASRRVEHRGQGERLESDGGPAATFAERASVAGITTAVAMPFLSLFLDSRQAKLYVPIGIAFGAMIGAWLARRVLHGGRQYYASLLVFAVSVAMTVAVETLHELPASLWGGPLQWKAPALAWIAGWPFVFALLATTARRSGPEGGPARVMGYVLAAAFVALGAVLLMSLF